MNYSSHPIEKVSHCPFSSISIGKKIKPNNSKKLNENIKKSSSLANSKDFDNRDYLKNAVSKKPLTEIIKIIARYGLGFSLLLLVFILVSTSLKVALLTILFVILFYKNHLTALRKEGWLEAVEEEHTHSPFSDEMKTTGGLEEKWLLAGPPTNEKQNWHQVLSHYPGYLWSMLFLFFKRVPLFIVRILGYSLKARAFVITPEITDRQIYDSFIESPLMVMAEMHDGFIEFTIPEIPLTTMKGLNISGFHLTFDIKNKTIVKSELAGENIIGDNNKIASLMIVALVLWANPQTHIVSEISAREIARKNIPELEPSNRFVVAVHDGLFYDPNSPLTKNHFFSMNIDKKSAIESATKIKMPHRIDKNKMQFRYFNFLIKARASIHKNIRKFNLNVNPEFLFNNIVVHSVDHHLLYQNLSKIPYWSLDGGTSLRSYFRSQAFLSV
ncbi:MAG: hypothetical protein NXI23_13900 [Bacteroidetes bacterium]|nr:hypothetical protein [Bacteroidota bacterium]